MHLGILSLRACYRLRAWWPPAEQERVHRLCSHLLIRPPGGWGGGGGGGGGGRGRGAAGAPLADVVAILREHAEASAQWFSRQKSRLEEEEDSRQTARLEEEDAAVARTSSVQSVLAQKQKTDAGGACSESSPMDAASPDHMTLASRPGKLREGPGEGESGGGVGHESMESVDAEVLERVDRDCLALCVCVYIYI